MKQIVVYVHGKGGSAEEAEHYSTLFPDSEVLGFDYRAQTPWEAREEFPRFFAAQRARSGRLTLIANSIGAYFSLLSLDETLVDAAYLISPVVDMEKLIGRMMTWANRAGACGTAADPHGVRRNALVAVSVRCARASGHVARPDAHSVRGAGRADRHADHYGVCGEERRSPDRHAGRRALVPHG